jgi:hypothetical protein
MDLLGEHDQSVNDLLHHRVGDQLDSVQHHEHAVDGLTNDYALLYLSVH